MRLHNNNIRKIFSGLLMSIILFVGLGFAQTTPSSPKSDKTDAKTPTCTCDQNRNTRRNRRHRYNRHHRYNKRGGERIRYIYTTPPSSEKPKPTVFATESDFKDLALQVGKEGATDGTVTLSNGQNPGDISDYIDVFPSTNLTAWAGISQIHAFSSNGGDGLIVVKNKNGTLLQVIKVTVPKQQSVITDTEQKTLDAANATAANTETLVTMGYWVIGLLVAILLALLFGIFQRRGLRVRLDRSNEMVENVEHNLLEALEHYGIEPRRREVQQPAEEQPAEDPHANGGLGLNNN